MIINTKDYIPAADAIKLLGLSRSRFYELVLKGRIKKIEPWRQPALYSINDIKKLLK